MSAAEALAAVMFLAITLYAVFGGADFGSGVWDLTAGVGQRGHPTRRLVDHAIGPVWEANHVWLIFVLVICWGGFPAAFVALMTELAIPFWLAALGIVIRGAGFAFRKYPPNERWAFVSGVAFALSSLITPFFLGAIAGSVASGRVMVDGSSDLWSPWINPTSVYGGVLAMTTSTFLAGVLLCAEARALGDEALAAELRSKSLLGGIITGIFVAGGVPILIIDDATLARNLATQALPVVLVALGMGVATMYLLWQGQLRAARVTAIAAVASVVAGWGVGQYPWLIIDRLTIDDAAGAPSSIVALLIASGVAGILVGPPLVYLFMLADQNRVGTAPSVSTDKDRSTSSDREPTVSS